ncbi:RNA polymerase sigma factor [Anaeromyxobacter paludicola]|uniref:RNA polymerase sigma factor n=1 Tax=Anaeromyxobacter paludicola TaxID=2918171 RepID=A0ABM7XDA8_9BACT|nr:RNA polymerase sigma factor [Anaeromyxobacter paludicola]BDG09865.1 RNA polymerase sigma factor [Anaeromyxobacter paludicola]
MASDPDAALMLAFQGGDERAFRTLFDRHGRAMVRFCHHYVKDDARAEELAQDVFLKVHRSAARYQPTARFKTWLYRIASNHCLNELRRGEYAAREPARADGVPSEPADLDALPGGATTPEEAAMGQALAGAVEGLLARLPEKQRAAFVLCRLEGLSYEEIAEVLETSVSAVKSLLHRATVAAAEALAPWSGPEKEVRP